MFKHIVKLLIFIVFFSSLEANEYRDIVNIKLKKDEHKKILVKYAKNEKLFTFRWTLYTNGGLVIFRSYDRVVAQNVLYAQHKRQSFRVELMTRGGTHYIVPYIMVKFIEFDYERDAAVFQLFLSDKNSKVILEYLDK